MTQPPSFSNNVIIFVLKKQITFSDSRNSYLSTPCLFPCWQVFVNRWQLPTWNFCSFHVYQTSNNQILQMMVSISYCNNSWQLKSYPTKQQLVESFLTNSFSGSVKKLVNSSTRDARAIIWGCDVKRFSGNPKSLNCPFWNFFFAFESFNDRN